MARTARSGTQSIERAVAIVKELAIRGNIGWRLSDLAGSCGLDRATTHRILACLQRERLVQQRSDRNYVPGPLLFELGLSLRPLAAFQAACRAPLARIARRTGGVGFLYLRSGGDFVCAGREGATSLKALSINIGTRRPLITAAGGAAILVALPEAQSRAIVAQNLAHVARFDDLRIRSLQRMLKCSQAEGFGLNLGDVVPGIHSVALAIRNAAGEPVAAIAVTGSAADLPAADVPRIVAILRSESPRITLEATRALANVAPQPHSDRALVDRRLA